MREQLPILLSAGLLGFFAFGPCCQDSIVEVLVVQVVLRRNVDVDDAAIHILLDPVGPREFLIA
jgi:hypothetical protein